MIEYQTAQQIMSSGTPCSVVDEIFDEFDRQMRGRLIDPDRIRRLEDWNLLSQQIVGGERDIGRVYD